MMPPSARSRPPVAPPSALLSVLGNLRVPPTVSWTLPLEKPRSPPQIGGLSGTPLDKTWQTLVVPPYYYRAAPPANSRPCGPSQRWEASCYHFKNIFLK